MSRIGIVAEFNPFHTGHKYIIEYAKNNLNADSVVIALGNEFTQRGGVAIIDRYSRAAAAIDAGADLIVSMPVTASCASAEIFAECGVCLLEACGCDRIVCGYEGGDKEMLHKTAQLLVEEPPAFKDTLQKGLRAGKSYPSAREDAVFSCIDSPEVKLLLSNPNNILAIEYEKAIIKHGFDIELIPVKRQGNGYNDSDNDGEFVSASYIRKQILAGNLPAVRNHLTDFSYNELNDECNKNVLLSDNDLSLPLHLELLGHNDYSKFLDVSPDLSDRIKKLLPEFVSISQFTSLLKNKSLTASRIRRALIHILLGITDKSLDKLREQNFVPELWILAASKHGLSLLKDIKSKNSVTLFFSLNEKDETGDRSLFHLELIRALRINKSGIWLPNEYQRKVHL